MRRAKIGIRKIRKIGQISINQNHPPYKKRVRFIPVQRRLHPRALDPFGKSAVHIAPRRAAIAWKCCRMHALAIFHLFAGPRCAWLWLVGAGAEAAAALRSLGSASRRGACGTVAVWASREPPPPTGRASSNRGSVVGDDGCESAARARKHTELLSLLLLSTVVEFVRPAVQQVKRCKWFALTKVPVTISPVATTTAPNTSCGRTCGRDWCWCRKRSAASSVDSQSSCRMSSLRFVPLPKGKNAGRLFPPEFYFFTGRFIFMAVDSVRAGIEYLALRIMIWKASAECWLWKVTCAQRRDFCMQYLNF